MAQTVAGASSSFAPQFCEGASDRSRRKFGVAQLFSLGMRCMQKAIAITSCSLVVSILLAIVCFQRQLIVRLQEQSDALLDENARLTGLISEVATPASASTETLQVGTGSDESKRELLRLRGEVTLLRKEQVDLQALRREGEALRSENLELRGLGMIEVLRANSLDTSRLAIVNIGAPKEVVLSELKRVGAKTLETNEEFIVSEAFTGRTTKPDEAPALIKSEFHFEKGRLTRRKDLLEFPQ